MQAANIAVLVALCFAASFIQETEAQYYTYGYYPYTYSYYPYNYYNYGYSYYPYSYYGYYGKRSVDNNQAPQQDGNQGQQQQFNPRFQGQNQNQ